MRYIAAMSDELPTNIQAFLDAPNRKTLKALEDVDLQLLQRHPFDWYPAARVAADEIVRRNSWRKPEGRAIYVSAAAAVISAIALIVSIFFRH